MSEKVVRRSADITPKEALNGLRAKFAGYRIVSFGLVSNGQAYEAKLVHGEFPPSAKDDDAGDEAPEADGPPAPAEDDGGDEGVSDGPPAPPKGKSKSKGGDHVEHEILDLLHQVADALGIAPPGAGAPGDVPPPGADPGMAGGDMPPPAAPDPLPPPAKPHGAPMGGGGLGSPFSKVAAERRSFVIWREPDADGSLPSIKQAVAEITAQLPTTHKVAKITKRAAKIEGGTPTNVYVVAITTR